MIVFLDSGILGVISSPSNFGEARECKQWLYQGFSSIIENLFKHKFREDLRNY